MLVPMNYITGWWHPFFWFNPTWDSNPNWLMAFMGLGRFRRSTLCRQLGDKVYALMDQLRQHQADLSDLDFFFEQFLVAKAMENTENPWVEESSLRRYGHFGWSIRDRPQEDGGGRCGKARAPRGNPWCSSEFSRTPIAGWWVENPNRK